MELPGARLHSMRQFTKYAALYDETTEIPPADASLMKRVETLYIYSREQSANFAGGIGWNPGWIAISTYVTLFGLLASTGLKSQARADAKPLT